MMNRRLFMELKWFFIWLLSAFLSNSAQLSPLGKYKKIMNENSRTVDYTKEAKKNKQMN